MKDKKMKELLDNPEFKDFYCYREDKWFQNANLEEKLVAVFGSIENAIKEFENDETFNSKINLK